MNRNIIPSLVFYGSASIPIQIRIVKVRYVFSYQYVAVEIQHPICILQYIRKKKTEIY